MHSGKIFISHNREDLIHPINDLLENIKKPLEKNGVIVFLNGQLGSGKTAFVQELGYHLGVKGRMQSPTFVLMKKYDIDSELLPELYTIIHIDAYRLEPHHKESLSVDEFINEPGTLVLIEWPTAIDLDQTLAYANVDFDFIPGKVINDQNQVLEDIRRVKITYNKDK